MRLLSALLADGATHTNSTDETVLASYSFPAESFQVGKVYRFRAAVEVPSTNSTDTLTLRARLGGTTLAGTAIFTSGAVDAANADLAVIDGEFTVRSIGATGVAAYAVAGSNPDAATIALGAHAGTATVDTTSACLLEITADWSVAHADNQCNATSFTVFEAV